MFIIGGIIKTMAGDDIEDGVIHVVNGKIAEIGRRDETAVHPADHEQVIESKTVLSCLGLLRRIVTWVSRRRKRLWKGMTVMRR